MNHIAVKYTTAQAIKCLATLTHMETRFVINSSNLKKFIGILVLGLLLSNNALAASEFCEGFKRGYIAGYKQAHSTGFDPFVPFCPFQPFKKMSDPQSDYEHGYIIGFKKGSRS